LPELKIFISRSGHQNPYANSDGRQLRKELELGRRELIFVRFLDLNPTLAIADMGGIQVGKAGLIGVAVSGFYDPLTAP